MSNAKVQYFESELDVRPGDRVKVRIWSRFLDGRVLSVPDSFKLRDELEMRDILEVVVKTCDGRTFGTVIDRDTNFVWKTVIFCERGESEEVPI